MTKNEIKAALDLAGVAYAKKANLATLQALYAQHIDVTDPTMPMGENGNELVEDTSIQALVEAAGGTVGTLDPIVEGFAEVDGKPVDSCPHCGIHLSNGLLHVDDCAANTNVTYRQQRDPAFEAGEWNCMACGGHFGAKVQYAPIQAGLKIEKDRPEQNGIKRPSAGGKCRAIWDALDAYREETGELPTSKVVKELAADEGWNPNNASIEFYQWRKFHGISKAK